MSEVFIGTVMAVRPVVSENEGTADQWRHSICSRQKAANTVVTMGDARFSLLNLPHLPTLFTIKSILMCAPRKQKKK